MNTIGKILVLLNFLFAIIVGALVVMVAATGNQWKEAYFALKREADIMKIGRDQDQNVRNKILAEATKEKLDNEQLKLKLKEQSDQFGVTEDTYRLQIATLENTNKEVQITLAQAQAALKRTADEVTLLKGTLTERELLIINLEAGIAKSNLRAQNFEQIARAHQLRNENLTDELRAITLAYTRLKSGVNPDAMAIRNPNDPNPPAVKVEGKIEKVEGDLVLISLGTDHGINKHNTLDVFRLQPDSKYLGMVRIVEANHHSSVCRLIPSGNPAFRPQLKTGDVVSSKIR
ncbi:MAG: hypothetical protein EXR98_09420 [Gemmataceae bacterium]|nr:hypothetical protein [Gemmataceae bacterium]